MTEFRAMVKHRIFRDGKWCLAIPGERTYKTFEEAQNAIQKAIDNGKPKMIECYSKEKGYYSDWYNSLEVIDSKIESREVSDWNEIHLVTK